MNRRTRRALRARRSARLIHLSMDAMRRWDRWQDALEVSRRLRPDDLKRARERSIVP